MKEFFTGEFFIIPNYFSRFKAEDTRSYESIQKELSEFGLQLKNKDYLVQIWATGSGSDNWQSHGNRDLSKFLYLEENSKLGKIHESLNLLLVKGILNEEEFERLSRKADIQYMEDMWNYRFPSYLPYNLLKDLKEGDEIILTHNKLGRKIKLIAKQQGYRYGGWGPFQGVLNQVKEASDKAYEKWDREDAIKEIV